MTQPQTTRDIRPELVLDTAHTGVRGAQSFVRVMETCWRRPALIGLELSWRWAFGIPALLLLWHEARVVLARAPDFLPLLKQFTVQDPLRAANDVAAAAGILQPPLLQIARWLIPLLAVGWSVASGVGRSVVLRRYDRNLTPRPATLVALQLAWVLSLLATVWAWWVCLQWIAANTVTGPEPNLIGYFAAAIVWSLIVFSAWALGSHVLSAAAILSATEGRGLAGSVRAAFALGRVRPKLLEINLALGIAKMATIVLAIVLSSIPLPFMAYMTGDALNYWYAACAVFYLAASDFFQVARLVAYIELWRAYRVGSQTTL